MAPPAGAPGGPHLPPPPGMGLGWRGFNPPPWGAAPFLAPPPPPPPVSSS